MPRVGKTLLKKMSGAPGYCDDNRALFAFEGGVNGDYGSGERNLQYFRKFRFRERGIECGLRKWPAKPVLLP